MRSAVALLLAISMLGCFPHDAHKRTLAQLVEGGAVVGGIALEAVLSTGADCDTMTKIGAPPDSNCHTKSTALGDVGVALILGGLLAFVATISTAEEAKTPPPIDIKAQAPAAKPDVKLPPGVKPQTEATAPATAAQTATEPTTPSAEPPPPAAEPAR